MSLFKTITPLDRGVNGYVRTRPTDPRDWITLTQLRSTRGIIENFPGWATILASGNAGGFGSLLAAFIEFAGTRHIMVGGPAKVYEFDSATTTLTDLSGAIVFAPTRDNPWSSVSYLDDFYLVNKVDGLHRWTGSGNVAVVAGTPPKAMGIGVLTDHLVLLNVNDGTERPQRVQWAKEGDPTNWTASATSDAGAFDLTDTPDPGMRLEQLGDDLVAYMEGSIIPVAFIGGNEVMGARRALTEFGLAGPHALANLGSSHIGIDEHTIYEYHGGENIDDHISDLIRPTVFDSIHKTIRNRTRVMSSPMTDEVLICYPDTTATNDANKCVVYNTREKTWSGPFSITTTMLALVRKMTATLGTPQLLFIDDTGIIHDIGAAQTANGTAITRTAVSTDHVMYQGAVDDRGAPVVLPADSVFMLTAVDLVFEKASTGTANLYIAARMDLDDAVSYSSAYSVDLTASHTIRVPVRHSGRYFRVKIELESSRELFLSSYNLEAEFVGRR